MLTHLRELTCWRTGLRPWCILSNCLLSYNVYLRCQKQKSHLASSINLTQIVSQSVVVKWLRTLWHYWTRVNCDIIFKKPKPRHEILWKKFPCQKLLKPLLYPFAFLSTSQLPFLCFLLFYCANYILNFSTHLPRLFTFQPSICHFAFPHHVRKERLGETYCGCWPGCAGSSRWSCFGVQGCEGHWFLQRVQRQIRPLQPWNAYSCAYND